MQKWARKKGCLVFSEELINFINDLNLFNQALMVVMHHRVQQGTMRSMVARHWHLHSAEVYSYSGTRQEDVQEDVPDHLKTTGLYRPHIAYQHLWCLALANKGCSACACDPWLSGAWCPLIRKPGRQCQVGARIWANLGCSKASNQDIHCELLLTPILVLTTSKEKLSEVLCQMHITHKCSTCFAGFHSTPQDSAVGTVTISYKSSNTDVNVLKSCDHWKSI